MRRCGGAEVRRCGGVRGCVEVDGGADTPLWNNDGRRGTAAREAIPFNFHSHKISACTATYPQNFACQQPSKLRANSRLSYAPTAL